MVDEVKMHMVPMGSDVAQDLWNDMFKEGVSMPVRVIPTIATYAKDEDYFIISFGFGNDPHDIECYRTVAVPIDAMELIGPDIVQQIAEYRMSKAN